MDRFTSWLGKEAQGKQIFGYIIGTITLAFFFTAFFLSLFYSTHTDLSSMSKSTADIVPGFLFLMIIPLITEEIMFRFLPLMWAKEMRFSIKGILIVALISSVFFGYIHGNAYNIVFQGTTGFLFSLLFLKCGGMQSKYFKATCCTFTAHYMFNAIIYFLAL